MVPDRMMKAQERYTGKWWFEATMPWLGNTPRIRIMIEIEEGWTGMCPPAPGREPEMNWRLSSRPATTKEVFMLGRPSLLAFQYAPPRAAL